MCPPSSVPGGPHRSRAHAATPGPPACPQPPGPTVPTALRGRAGSARGTRRGPGGAQRALLPHYAWAASPTRPRCRRVPTGAVPIRGSPHPRGTVPGSRWPPTPSQHGAIAGPPTPAVLRRRPHPGWAPSPAPLVRRPPFAATAPRGHRPDLRAAQRPTGTVPVPLDPRPPSPHPPPLLCSPPPTGAPPRDPTPTPRGPGEQRGGERAKSAQGAARREGARSAQGARRGAAGLQGAAAAGGGGCGRGGAGGRRGGAGGGAWRSRRPPPPPLPCAPLGPAPLRSSPRSAPAPLRAPHGPVLRYGPAAPMFTGRAPARPPLSSTQGRGVQRWRGGGGLGRGGGGARTERAPGGEMRCNALGLFLCTKNQLRAASPPARREQQRQLGSSSTPMAALSLQAKPCSWLRL